MRSGSGGRPCRGTLLCRWQECHALASWWVGWRGSNQRWPTCPCRSRFHVPATALPLRVGHRAIYPSIGGRPGRSEAFAVDRFGTASLSCPRGSRGPIAARNFSGWCMHACLPWGSTVRGSRGTGLCREQARAGEESACAVRVVAHGLGWLVPRSLRGFGGLVPLELWAVPVSLCRADERRPADKSVQCTSVLLYLHNSKLFTVTGLYENSPPRTIQLLNNPFLRST